MTLAGVVALAVTLQALSASLLLVASREVDRSATSDRALQAEAVWRSTAAAGAEPARLALAALAPGETQVLGAVPAAPGWEVVAIVVRAPVGAVGALRLGVVRRAPDGTPLAARHGTLLLPQGAADTAVIGSTNPMP
jgi:hypothetical protein